MSNLWTSFTHCETIRATCLTLHPIFILEHETIPVGPARNTSLIFYSELKCDLHVRHVQYCYSKVEQPIDPGCTPQITPGYPVLQPGLTPG